MKRRGSESIYLSTYCDMKAGGDLTWAPWLACYQQPLMRRHMPPRTVQKTLRVSWWTGIRKRWNSSSSLTPSEITSIEHRIMENTCDKMSVSWAPLLLSYAAAGFDEKEREADIPRGAPCLPARGTHRPWSHLQKRHTYDDVKLEGRVETVDEVLVCRNRRREGALRDIIT
ncbi:hypothetical protein B296_00023940 [Ensete ventricosum]|uniref:Uncharacterized protein n=1 Tax=Ensete ventricosum TaxID=4639 RepID=A0A426ZJA8_ENSVE|nr:hypothetical protein B296_00023940 [Ensete ventricosum]